MLIRNSSVYNKYYYTWTSDIKARKVKQNYFSSNFEQWGLLDRPKLSSMKFKFLFLFLASFLNEIFAQSKCFQDGEKTSTFFSFNYQNLDGQKVDFKKYHGYVTLVVNVATYWGMTTTTYTQLNTLMHKYGANNKCGLKILAFPCNQVRHLS